MKNKFIKVLAVTLIAASLAPQAAMAAPVNSRVSVTAAVSVKEKRGKVVDEAKKQLGVPYVWGGASPSGFDCSGLVVYVYKKALNKNLPHGTSSLINEGTEVSRSDLKRGDLVFPHSGHVGIYIGDGKFIHAPHKGDVVKISKLDKFWRARRIIQ